MSVKTLFEPRPEIRPTEKRLPAQRARTSRAAPAPDAFDRGYWLAHCEGFRVEASGGAVGFVDSVLGGSEGQPTLVIRAGLLGRRLLVVSSSSVAFIVPRARKIWLHSPVEILGTSERGGAAARC